MRYIDQSTRDEAAEAYRSGIPLDRIAGHLGVTVAELRHVLGLPQWKEIPAAETGCDLWRVDEADGVL